MTAMSSAGLALPTRASRMARYCLFFGSSSTARSMLCTARSMNDSSGVFSYFSAYMSPMLKYASSLVGSSVAAASKCSRASTCFSRSLLALYMDPRLAWARDIWDWVASGSFSTRIKYRSKLEMASLLSANLRWLFTWSWACCDKANPKW
ncbi:hypothetical protein H257_12880 [Aphanomyces astaci]|uniref:Uncharacterized protein n=1 Tax=Aphanomyces astaci TaxID=112090 RepID=W4FYN8_APHAT|nr:hypothetical protein H257_12880 [Aphanomyces astaci]ETV72096.1 hypothetical protein H257_12880 [Aphanomyces astaci]|eukprot:XP_009838539.1 hypothetical protein H257_12880 [Aphanomyces astaci]